ncbi:Gfo/Idh/MocA family protein [Sediminicola luteus]|uniref:Oxidoreductase n=1 Tax=Sediminicola luteus TaxID=319238 RepID=A0A2A4G8I3_9FLAO|nr:Gfo/Idh/MocA family oxidoreductase [Sediminicola luteus]PCE64065.1 oxidoreductase [Sediminicola luteus]
MDKQSVLRWGMIGCGSVTELKSAPAYQITPGFELRAVMGRNLEKVNDYAQRHQVPKVYTNVQDLIQDPEVDAVYIATPPDSHKEYALQIAQAGKPCCIEKPLAPNYQDSLAIVNAFAKAEVPVFVAYYRRSLPRFLKIKTWLDSGSIGEIRHIHWRLVRPPKDIDISGGINWRTDVEVAPGGYFDDLASHGLDLFAFLLGDFVEVSGVALNQQGLYTAKDAMTAAWLHANGTTGAGSWHFGCDRYEDVVTIYGSRGKITFSVFGEEALLMESDRGREEVFIDNPQHVQQFHVENMKKHLVDGTIDHPSTGKSALHTSWVMDKILGAI